jgi:hypothetical protein
VLLSLIIALLYFAKERIGAADEEPS